MSGSAEAIRGLELAEVAWACGDIDAVVVHLSAAVRGFTAAGEPCRAAMACVRLGETFAVAMGNLTVSRAWFARARRLVEAEPACVEQGWAAVAALGCDVDDPAELLVAAELALDRARRFGDVNLETKALADGGLAHVQIGRVAQGMRLLDEAMALACGPADDPDSTGKSICSFFTACYYAADFARAGSWAEPLRRHRLIGSGRGAPIFLSSHCDSVQATLLMELGRWGEAEALLITARGAFEAAMSTRSWHPEIALADLRVRQGRLAEAEALLVGKDQSLQALLPAARLQLARGDYELAQAMARRGLRVTRDDRLRSIELLALVVDAELGRGDLDAARVAGDELIARSGEVGIVSIEARTAATHARLLAAADQHGAAVVVLESAIDRLDSRLLPCARALLLIDLARLRDALGDLPAAAIDALAAASILATLDVVLAPTDAALLDRLCQRLGTGTHGVRTAELSLEGKWWVASCAGSNVRLHDTKGLRYLAELIIRQGSESHALDLVDHVEGVAPSGGPNRRLIGDAGPVLDASARSAYRRQIESLRADIDDALEAGRHEAAEAMQAELDKFVAQLAQAFGLGGRDRRAASAAERARLNVTRALRSSIARLVDAMPGAGEVLDRRIRTGLYCAYEPADGDEVRWIVQSRVNTSSRK